jgi:periplasmic protein TonB
VKVALAGIGEFHVDEGVKGVCPSVKGVEPASPPDELPELLDPPEPPDELPDPLLPPEPLEPPELLPLEPPPLELLEAPELEPASAAPVPPSGPVLPFGEDPLPLHPAMPKAHANQTAATAARP